MTTCRDFRTVCLQKLHGEGSLRAGLKAEGHILMQYDMCVLIVHCINGPAPPGTLIPIQLCQFHADIIRQQDLQLLHKLVDQLVQSEESI